ncbi:transposase [Streptomyces sp. SAS_270]|uniref:transposase n=1 Tax=Streptomyces sp. SAS_270 TaxID=3412748 RepID=UPI00403C0BA5
MADQGTDAGNRIIGRKRRLGCDTLGLLLTVLVTAASVSDTPAGVTLLSRIAAAYPHVTKGLGGRRLPHHGHRPRRPHRRPARGARGFTIIPRRWTIERSIGRLMHHRHLARDYETRPHRTDAMIHLAMIDLMARRLIGEATLNWHGT